MKIFSFLFLWMQVFFVENKGCVCVCRGGGGGGEENDTCYDDNDILI